MKATGIVRRIDDLGRVVIPKEIRRTLRIREGDPLEIYTDNSGGVVFKKYSPIGELSNFVGEYAEGLSRMLSLPVVICDREQVVAVAGASKKEYFGRRVTPMLEDLVESRKSFFAENKKDAKFEAIEGIENSAMMIFPILNSGDIEGSVVVFGGELDHNLSETELKLTQLTAEFLGKQLQ